MTDQKRIFRWFWAWQDEKEQAWLSDMAAQGWHLDRLGFPGLYHFRAGDSSKMVYRLDYRTLQHRERESYLQLFEDAGWEHVGDLSGWVYFRKEVQPGEDPEIFSDLESKSKKYQRLLLLLVIFLPILTVLMPEFDQPHGGLFSILTGLYVVLILFYVYAMIRLLGRIGELQKKEKK